MSQFLIFANLHLGLELLGGIVFLIIGWLFAEAYLIKRDRYSFAKGLGFFLLAFFQALHVMGGTSSTFIILSSVVYGAGLLSIIFGFGSEHLPKKPELIIPLAAAIGVALSLQTIFALAILFISVLLVRRYSANIDRDIKWMAVAFLFFTIASSVQIFSPVQGDTLWYIEQAAEMFAFASFCLWTWRFLSLRLREEALIVFTSIALFMALLVTTAFSAVIFQKSLDEAQKNLEDSAQITNFYLENLKSKSLAASQIISRNDVFVSSFEARDIGSLGKISNELLFANQESFLTAAMGNGSVFFKSSFPILKGENILDERIVADASQGLSTSAVDNLNPEGLSVRAAASVLHNGRLLGTVLVGSLLDVNFTDMVKKVTGFEASLIVQNKIVASSVFPPGATLVPPSDEYAGIVKSGGEEFIAKFTAIKNVEDTRVATLALTTTPHELVNRVQGTNSLTIILVFLIAAGFIIPVYRFSVYLTER